MKKSSYSLLFCLLSAASFSALANDDIIADASAGETKAQTCVACHGAQGNSVMPDWPKLAGQGAKYIEHQLHAFKAGERKNALMAPMAEKLSEQDIADVAAYFSTQSVTIGKANPELVEAGEALYRGGDLERGIPACIACHGPSGSGNPAAAYPAVKGQHSAYIKTQLKAFRSQERNNDVMQDIAEKMRVTDIEAVSSYIEGLH